MTFDHEESPYSGPSKSARKRAAKAVEELANELVTLPKARLAGMELPADIRKELELARGTRGHGSRKRQIKHLAGLLRKDEDMVEELNAFLAGSHEQQYEEKKLFHQLESLRDGLCDAASFETTLRLVQEQFPSVDADALSQLAHRLHSNQDRHAFREIFRILKAAASEQSA
ncbi:MAG: DUF615 domain-containing protein [Deltaproteobacteria bacterium]|nr:DUF615 domain-containing protein [Deltaproteobacteria bacterium]